MMKALLLISFAFFTAQSYAANPAIQAAELNGTYPGESGNGACSVQFQAAGEFLSVAVDQNMFVTRALPVSSRALLQKISGDQCGGMVANNFCGDYDLKDSVENGGNYSNEIAFSSYTRGTNRCVSVYVVDASFSKWIGSNRCIINLDRSGQGCGKRE